MVHIPAAKTPWFYRVRYRLHNVDIRLRLRLRHIYPLHRVNFRRQRVLRRSMIKFSGRRRMLNDNARFRCIMVVFQPYGTVMHQGSQGIELAKVFKLKALQYLPESRKLLLSLIKLAEVTVVKGKGSHQLLQTLAESAKDFHTGVHRLRPARSPLMAYESLQYCQPFIQAG